MFDYLVDDNRLRPVMEEHGLVLPEDLNFIKEQIAGPTESSSGQGEKVTNMLKKTNRAHSVSLFLAVLLQHSEFLQSLKKII